MIYVNGKEISAIAVGTRIITEVYHGASLVWQAIRSCFGAGYWIQEYPWVDDDPWANG